MADVNSGSVQSGSTPQRPKRRLVKVVGVIGALLMVVAVVLVALAPRIASGLAPGIIQEQAAKHVKGSVAVGGASFSWGGPQRVGPITWKDETGETVAVLEAETSAGLVGLVMGGLDLGTVTVSGAEVHVVRGADGSLNVQSLLKQPPSPPAPGGSGGQGSKQPITLPKGFKVKLAVTDLAVTFVDNASASAVPVSATLSGTANIDPNQPLTIGFAGTVGQRGGAMSPYQIDVRVTNWASSDAAITPAKANVTAKLGVDALPLAMIDALTGPLATDAEGHAVPFARALGPTASISVDANGSLQDATAMLRVKAERASAEGDIRIADGLMTTASPLVVHAAGGAVGDLVPALGAATRTEAETRLDAIPDVTLTIDNLSIKVPQGGGPLDLRGAAARVRVALSQISGRTRLSPSEHAQAMQIAPLTATVETQDLATGVRIIASTSATLANQPAGDVKVDMTASGLLDEKGSVARTPPLLSGTAQVQRISTAIAQPFVQSMGIDLPRDVGPTLDLDVKASTRATATDIDVSAQATHLTAAGGFTVSPSQIATRSNDFTLTMKRGGGIIGMFVKPETGFRVEPPASGAGDVTVSLRGISIPRETPPGAAASVLRLDQTSGNVLVTAAGLRVSRVGADAAPLDLKDITLRTVVAPGKESTLDLHGAGSHAGTPFSIKGNFSITDLWVSAGGAAPAINTNVQALRPAGRLQVIDLPSSAAALAQAAPRPGTVPLDLAGLTREVFGDKIGLDLGIKRTEDAATTELVARITGGQSNVVTRFRLSPTELKGTENFVKLMVSPSLVDTLVRGSKPDLAGKLRLAAATEVQLGVAPFTVPMQGLTPQWNKAQPVHATVTIPGKATVDGLAAFFDEGSAMRSLTSAGVDTLSIEADVPLVGVVPAKEGSPASKAAVHATLRTKLIANGDRAADVAGTLAGDIASAKPVGPFTVNLDVTNVATGAVEKVMGQAGLLTSMLGETARVTLNATTDPSTQVTTAEVAATAPKLTSEGPIAVRLSQQAIEVTKSATWRFTLAPGWINEKLAPAAVPGEQAKPAAFVVTSPVNVGVTIDRLTLPRAVPDGAAQPMTQPPPFSVGLSMDIPKIDAVSSDNRSAVLDNATLTLATKPGTEDSPSLAFQLNIATARAGDSPPASNVGIAGTIDHFVSAQGVIDPAHARVTAAGKIPSLPTALVDVLAGQDGLLVEALGPLIALDLDARNVPIKPAESSAAQPASNGTLKLNATSDRATFSAEGSIDDAVLTLSQPLNVSILELTDALAGRFVKGLPAIGTIQKAKTDRPAMIVGDNLTIPLSKDCSKLNGTIRIDPGEARFGTSSLFGQLLDLAKIRTTGVVGQRLDPLTVTITKGVANYPRYKLPLGEFAIESEGTVDLTSRSVDVVTWVPLGSLTDQAAGIFKSNTGIGGLLNEVPILDAATMVPFRTKGSFDDPKTGADLELFGRNLLQNVNPGKLIEKGLDELFKKKEGK